VEGSNPQASAPEPFRPLIENAAVDFSPVNPNGLVCLSSRCALPVPASGQNCAIWKIRVFIAFEVVYGSRIMQPGVVIIDVIY
jgi:hypothetical protein